MKHLNLLLSVLLFGAALVAQDVTPAAPAEDAPKPYTVVAVYPLDVCVVSGEDLDPEDQKVFKVDGREFRTCCGNCQKKGEADPDKFAPKLDAAIANAQRPNYPLEACPVSKKPLGSMGDPYEKVLDGTLVRMCCKGCDSRATKNAAEITAMIRDTAYEAQKKAYPMTTCVVSGEDLDDDAVATMLGNRLVQTCCKNCAKKVIANPAKFLAKLDAAQKKADEAKKQDGADKAADGGKVAIPAMVIPGAGGAAAAAGGKAGCCGTACIESVTGGGCCMNKPAAKQPEAKPTTEKKPEAKIH